MNEWDFLIEGGNVFIVSNGKKIAKMLTDDFTQEEMVNNASLIKVLVNNHLKTI